MVQGKVVDPGFIPGTIYSPLAWLDMLPEHRASNKPGAPRDVAPKLLEKKRMW